MSTALITGPTAGLGREFANQLAARGHDLILVSRRREKLQEVADELSAKHRIACEVLPADLSNRADTRAVEGRLADKDRPVDWLINNAGFGYAEPFMNTTVDQEQALLDVLVTAPMRLTHAALPGMLERGFGRIIVVSSFASWLSTGTYSAAKSWATVFVEGVSTELKDDNVNITAVCPGFIRTEFHERADMDVADVPKQLWLQPGDVVASGLRAVDHGNVICVPGKQYSALAPIARMLPRSLIRRVSAGGMSSE